MTELLSIPAVAPLISVSLAGIITILGSYLNMRWTKKQLSFDTLAKLINDIKKEVELKQSIASCEKCHTVVSKSVSEIGIEVELKRNIADCKEFRERLGKESMDHYNNYKETLVSFSRMEKYLILIMTSLGINPSDAKL